ncbi:thioredoxin-related transmembrane protein 1-like, partial [Saccoglossus kowalevskii]
ELISMTCEVGRQKKILITHGTDTMIQTASYLAQKKLKKTIIFTGAFLPETFKGSDAEFNIGVALGALQCLSVYGVYVCMNGTLFLWNQVERNYKTGHYAPWCPACKGLEATWNNFAEWSDDLDITVAEVDVTQEPGLSGRFMVTSLPSIYHVINGEFRRYMGPRSKDEFMTFIEDRKYVEIEPVPSWKSPDSIVMSFLGWLFKVSMVVRNIHTSLTEDYNIPVYGSYAIFAIATVVMGLLLGVAMNQSFYFNETWCMRAQEQDTDLIC